MDPDPAGTKPARRVRYRGKYPKRFEERYKELHPEAYPGILEKVRARGDTPAGSHVPVLVREVMDGLRPAPGEVVIDCTLGAGGHAREFLARIGPDGLLLGLDADAVQLGRTAARLAAEEAGPFRARHANFTAIRGALAMEGLDGADVIFADLGVSSMQIDDPSRGFSYKVDGPLDMRMDGRARRTAADLLATIPGPDLERALADLADEPDAAAIAREVVARRAGSPIQRTRDLVHVVLAAKRMAMDRRKDDRTGHPAKRTFQALRILVNDELPALVRLLNAAPDCLRPGGRIGILAFHSGEDRLVKESFRDGLRGGVYSRIAGEGIRPSDEEVRSNPRCASARFRWAERQGRPREG
jgi:16S rRNA (cytosine1402-N4)-methyltransferase